MRAVRESDIAIKREGAVLVRVLMTPADGLAGLSITQVDIQPGSATPDHTHDTDQVVYVLEGDARFIGEGEEHRLGRGDLIYVPAGQVHRHECAGDAPLRQLSLFLPAERGA